MVASADAESRCLGGAAEPPRGSNESEYTGPLCPINFRVVLPSGSCRREIDVADEKVDQIHRASQYHPLTVSHGFW